MGSERRKLELFGLTTSLVVLVGCGNLALWTGIFGYEIGRNSVVQDPVDEPPDDGMGPGTMDDWSGDSNSDGTDDAETDGTPDTPGDPDPDNGVDHPTGPPQNPPPGNGGEPGNDKVTICHMPSCPEFLGQSPGKKELTIPWNAVDAHLAHGDMMGSCSG